MYCILGVMQITNRFFGIKIGGNRMDEKRCALVLDILPLYVDQVCSEESRRYIEEHLENCENCKKEYEQMERDLVVPAEKDVSLIKKIKRRNRTEKIVIAGTVAIFFLILFAVFIQFALAPRINVNGDVVDQVSVKQDSQGIWWLNKQGNALDVSRVGMRVYKEDGTLLVDTVNAKVNGKVQEESNVQVELIFCGSLFSKLGHSLYDMSESQGGTEEKSMILGESWKDRVQSIYYMDGDRKINLWEKTE